ncbi:tyrosine-type recombinase/integrase [Craurococcus roseus]|uniref:Tyrosine-type recombinase/integrase n=1 Tax=Craurococcus roseus TaxID=77585 RepID=A0ABN1EPI8_9PROT
MRVLREGPARITKATVDAAWRRRRPGERLLIGDAGCRGLALVVNPTGMAWRFDYKARGTDPRTGKRFPTRSVTIGNPETHSPDAARNAAGRIKGEAKAGADPAAVKRAAIAGAAKRRALTMDRLVEDCATALPSRPKLRGTGTVSAAHAADEVAHVKAAVAAMKAGDRPVAEIGVAELRAALAAFAPMPATARHRFGALSRFFDWCQDEGHVALNPCALVAKARRPRAVAARQHHLAPAELARLWHAAGEADGLAPVHRDLIRFLLAVPCRRGEAAAMDWAHVALGAGVWTQPGALTKNGDLHRVQLPPLALGILRERHAATGAPGAGLVFPAPKSRKPVDTFSDMKAALCDAAFGGWRWHDFRRSFATALGEGGVAEPVVDAVLNHRQAATRGGVLGVYQRAQRWPEQVRAMEVWGAILAAAIEGRAEDARVARLPVTTTT